MSELDDLFAPCAPQVRATYDAIMTAARGFGEVRADPKKTSVHLVAGTGFAGAHPRKTALLLNIRTGAPIDSPRIRKVERVSANRFHNEMLLGQPSEVDEEVIGWLKAAFSLGRR